MEILIRLLFWLKKILPRPVKNALRNAYARHKLEVSPPPIPVENYFKADHSKRVLLSYVVGPFLGGELDSHSNCREALIIAECFHHMGYCVDVISYDFSWDIDYSRYNCIFGLGEPLERSFYQDVPNLIRIHYATGHHVRFQNSATLKRAQTVHESKGVWLLDSCRVVPWTWSAQTTLSSTMIVSGNKRVMESYRSHYQGPILPQIVSHYAMLPPEKLTGKNFAQAKNNFLYFSSMGAIHKGLDLLLQVFAKTPDKTLHIAAPLESEPAFTRVFAEELACPNIKLHGFLDVRSEVFCTLMRECAFAVLPSCSEAMASSLLNVMCNGLIPVLTPECGFDAMPYAVQIDAPDAASVKSAVSICSSLSTEEVKRRSLQCLAETRRRYSLDAFRAQMAANLLQICSVQESC